MLAPAVRIKTLPATQKHALFPTTVEATVCVEVPRSTEILSPEELMFRLLVEWPSAFQAPEVRGRRVAAEASLRAVLEM